MSKVSREFSRKWRIAERTEPVDGRASTTYQRIDNQVRLPWVKIGAGTLVGLGLLGVGGAASYSAYDACEAQASQEFRDTGEIETNCEEPFIRDDFELPNSTRAEIIGISALMIAAGLGVGYRDETEKVIWDGIKAVRRKTNGS